MFNVEAHVIEIGDHVCIIADGEFNGYAGTVCRIRQTTRDSRIFYWIEIPDHPWSVKDNPLWAFERHEIEEENE